MYATPFPLRSRGPYTRRVVLVAALVLAFLSLGLVTDTASAATYTNDCPAADDACKALAERSAQTNDELELLADKLDALHADLTTTPGTTDIAGTVALSSDDAERLDLVWYGVWLLAGITLVLIVAPMFVKAFRFWS